MKEKKSIVCLGGGIGTVNLVKGLRHITDEITVIISMADEGGSAGRLRRLYNIQPSGDLVSCMAALTEEKNPLLAKLLTYRFSGDRYGKDEELSGHKLGNLMMVALRDIAGSFDDAIILFQKLFKIPGKFLPATTESVSISALTKEGKTVYGEETIDLGKYNGERVIDRVFLHPEDAKATPQAVTALETADVIIAGPGDLYSTLLPVLIVPQITEALKKSKAKKIFVINIANKPFETKGYFAADFIKAIEKHIGYFPFDTVILNNNFSVGIPRKFHYTYVKHKTSIQKPEYTLIEKDLLNVLFPIYHDSEKLAKAVEAAL